MTADITAIMAQLRELARRVALQTGVELWELELRGSGSQRRLRIFIDKKEGVNLEDCEQYSRQISPMLDIENLIPGGRYTLEVSSPGWERVLARQEHFQRSKGKRIKITLAHPLPNRQRHLTGWLDAANEQGIRLRLPESGTAMDIEYAEIARAQAAPLGTPAAPAASDAGASTREGNEV